MSEEALVPPPPVVRERLAENLEEARLLRRLLRLSERFAERRHRRRLQPAATLDSGEGKAVSQ
jgi:hypothetical protein